MKRTDYISWDEYFMGIALLSAHRSKDPVNQIGACIVNDKKIIGMGYNGFPRGCSDEDFPWKKDPNMLEDKRTYVVHAEANAILNSYGKLDGATMYVVLFPCNECTKLIIQSGIKKIFYISDEDAHKDHNKASKMMLKSAGIETEQFIPKNLSILINFEK